jgi:hypothetical protein
MDTSVEFHHFLSFPNYNPTLRTNKIIRRGFYSTLEDVIRTLYNLNFLDRHIRDVYSTFHEHAYLTHSLKTVRAVIIQIEPVCCSIDKIYVLENTAVPISERVMYIRMHEFAGGARRRCSDIQNAALCAMLGLFAIIGLVIALKASLDIIISSSK